MNLAVGSLVPVSPRGPDAECNQVVPNGTIGGSSPQEHVNHRLTSSGTVGGPPLREYSSCGLAPKHSTGRPGRGLAPVPGPGVLLAFRQVITREMNRSTTAPSTSTMNRHP